MKIEECNRRKRRGSMNQCENCAYYSYDEEYEEYVCDAYMMDEDDYVKLMNGSKKACPYYRDGDEYRVVRHQN